MGDPRVDLGTLIESISSEIRGLPRITWLVVAAGEAGLIVLTRLVEPLATVLIVLEAALIETYLVAAILGEPSRSARQAAVFVRRRWLTVLGFDILEGLSIGLVAVVPLLVIVFATVQPPTTAAAPPAASSTTTFLVATLLLLAAPFYARWASSIPLIVERTEGARSAMRRSWTATRGSTMRVAIVYALALIPPVVETIVPAAVRLPVMFVGGAAAYVFQASVSVAAFRQLFPSLDRDYPLTDAGRIAFEADAATMARQGYFVLSTVDEGETRSITFGLPPTSGPQWGTEAGDA